MPYSQRAFLRIELKSEYHSLSEITSLVQVLDNLLMASVLGAMNDSNLKDENLLKARYILHGAIKQNQKSDERFNPYFKNYFEPFLLPERIYLENNYRVNEENNELDSSNPMDLGMQLGINAWARKEIYLHDRTLYNNLFTFAEVKKLEHNSPLLIEISVVLGAAIVVPAVLLYGMFRAVQILRKKDLENDIRQNEVNQKQVQLTQSERRTEIITIIRDVLKEKMSNNEVIIPDSVLAEAAKIADVSIAELKGDPLINQLSVGINIGN